MIFISTYFISSSEAYDWDKCRRHLAKVSKNAGMYGGIVTTTIYPSQFTSSWGACSALGKPEEDREVFFNDNFEGLKINFAQGNGELMKVFMSFYKCSIYGEEEFIKIVRNNYKMIFGTAKSLSFHEIVHPEDRSKNPEDWNISAEDSFTRLFSIIEKDDVVIRECKILK